jgi:UDP-N-acetylmuramate: L-alanyl-gamma-D-glutamyl-meso-diaminopimelate ligase
VPEPQRLSEPELVAAVEARGTPARFLPRVDEIVACLAAEARRGDRIVVLSNGGFGSIHLRLLQALSDAPGA